MELDNSTIRAARLREAVFGKSAEDLEIVRNRVLTRLGNGLWHTTSLDRYDSILLSNEILPEPNIPDRERRFTAAGRDHYPYVRFLGGVSVFDFDHFERTLYSSKYPASTWATFVPYQTHWDSSVWIELDRERIATNFISGLTLLARWKSENAHGHMIMPEIEAAHLGPVPRSAFKQAFIVGKNTREPESIAI